MTTETLLHYDAPAEDFNQALPVGNGRIGAMVFGKPEKELIRLNEDSIWSGGLRHRINPDALEGLEEVRPEKVVPSPLFLCSPFLSGLRAVDSGRCSVAK